MNVKTVKKPKRRVDIGYVSRFKMQAYGYDNLYPQNLARITEASGTAMLCLNRYARFIEGYGFDSDVIAALAMNQQGDTADDLLRNVAQDLARFGGGCPTCQLQRFRAGVEREPRTLRELPP